MAGDKPTKAAPMWWPGTTAVPPPQPPQARRH